MADLRDILYGVGLQEVSGNVDIEINSMTMDSRTKGSKQLFCALPGTRVDGHDFIVSAIKNGATAVLCERIPDEAKELGQQATFLVVDSSAQATGIAADNFYGNPSQKLKLVGVTGTNGKTTVVTLLHRLFTSMGHPVGLISTVENKIGELVIPATHTTPDAISLNALLAQMVAAGCEYVFMEVSSHAVVQHRIAGLTFEVGVFTNLSHDHLDYHKTFKEYIKAKKSFFDGLKAGAAALSNRDDKQGKVMLQNTRARQHTYGLKSAAEFRAKILENSFQGLLLNLDGHELNSLLIGEFNAYNLLAVYATAVLLGEDKMEVLQQLSALQAAEGRFDYLLSEKEHIVGIVDYAHTPDALEKILLTIKAIRTGNEKVITIVGCGGDRDRGKRPLMAKVACKLSDRVILTSDNPRSEVPEAIINDMEAGVPVQHQRNTLSITDRREAIKTACMLAEKQDIILLAGKGHEKYQEIKGERYPFDDKEILITTLKEMKR